MELPGIDDDSFECMGLQADQVKIQTKSVLRTVQVMQVRSKSVTTEQMMMDEAVPGITLRSVEKCV